MSCRAAGMRQGRDLWQGFPGEGRGASRAPFLCPSPPRASPCAQQARAMAAGGTHWGRRRRAHGVPRGNAFPPPWGNALGEGWGNAYPPQGGNALGEGWGNAYPHHWGNALGVYRGNTYCTLRRVAGGGGASRPVRLPVPGMPLFAPPWAGDSRPLAPLVCIYLHICGARLGFYPYFCRLIHPIDLGRYGRECLERLRTDGHRARV